MTPAPAVLGRNINTVVDVEHNNGDRSGKYEIVWEKRFPCPIKEYEGKTYRKIKVTT